MNNIVSLLQEKTVRPQDEWEDIAESAAEEILNKTAQNNNLLEALETVTAALHDIIMAAHNNEPYTAAEIAGFIPDYEVGRDTIERNKR